MKTSNNVLATTRTRIVAAALTAAGALLSSALPASAAWQHAHGDSANTGFARVDTDPADSFNQVTQLGPLAPGANPVIGPDGTLYIGNLAGELRAFHADGTPYWTRQLNGLHGGHGGIFAAPVVGADGSIYVISSIRIRDHRGGVTVERNDSFLHKFSPGGAWFFWRPFPEHSDFTNSAPADGGATTAPPNIWRANGAEAIMVPVLYPGRYGGKDLRLIAFSTNGAVLGDKLVTPEAIPEITGASATGTASFL